MLALTKGVYCKISMVYCPRNIVPGLIPNSSKDIHTQSNYFAQSVSRNQSACATNPIGSSIKSFPPAVEQASVVTARQLPEIRMSTLVSDR